MGENLHYIHREKELENWMKFFIEKVNKLFEDLRFISNIFHLNTKWIERVVEYKLFIKIILLKLVDWRNRPIASTFQLTRVFLFRIIYFLCHGIKSPESQLINLFYLVMKRKCLTFPTILNYYSNKILSTNCPFDLSLSSDKFPSTFIDPPSIVEEHSTTKNLRLYSVFVERLVIELFQEIYLLILQLMGNWTNV
ncbi:hypothetical protein SNEBB_002410 [Seison nebaliae]|nr:hypothetical protein SNEBB_002410 [Seison nebaliae]